MGKKLDIKTPFVSANNADLLTRIIGSDSKPVDLTGSDLLKWIPEKMQEDLYNFNEDYIIALETNDALTQLKVRFHEKLNDFFFEIYDMYQIVKGLFNGETYRYGNNKVVIEKVSLGNREKRAHITQIRLTRSSSVSSTTSN